MPINSTFLFAMGAQQALPATHGPFSTASNSQWVARALQATNASSSPPPEVARDGPGVRSPEHSELPARPSGKAGVRERQYSVQQLRAAILSSAKAGKPMSSAAACAQQGAPSMRSPHWRDSWSKCGRSRRPGCTEGYLKRDKKYTGVVCRLLWQFPCA